MRLLFLSLRSAAFLFCFLLIGFVSFVVTIPFSFSSRAILFARHRLWMSPTLSCLRFTCGITFCERGLDNIPDGPCIFASQHQSIFEVIYFGARFRDIVYVLKREIYRIPLLGYYMWRTGMIPLDRGRGLGALARLRKEARRRRGHPGRIVIFPEGTRIAPGKRVNYLPGVAILANELGVPVVPVALNSGYLWGKRRFLKLGGCVTISFLPPISPNLPPRELLSRLQSAIENTPLPSPRDGC
ncbi:MAG: 1-acyl-sn-glycerol-3-phosphate acyltransferase [Alphaproteobacteria bacterium]